ncbi:MAG TPA: hypothetical protein VGO70_11375 [Arsenicitalea sp.]|nr:hypothetical protein [Arsenicitalea sp.]
MIAAVNVPAMLRALIWRTAPSRISVISNGPSDCPSIASASPTSSAAKEGGAAISMVSRVALASSSKCSATWRAPLRSSTRFEPCPLTAPPAKRMAVTLPVR